MRGLPLKVKEYIERVMSLGFESLSHRAPSRCLTPVTS
jgi:hypothetical protein